MFSTKLLTKINDKELRYNLKARYLLVVLFHQMEKVCGQFLLSHANHVPKHEETQLKVIQEIFISSNSQTINKTVPCDGIFYTNIPSKIFQQFLIFLSKQRP